MAGRTRLDRRRHAAAALVAVLVASLVVMAEAPVLAHGEVDQQLTNPDGSHPDCTSADLPGTRLLDTPLRQSFVPSRGGLASVDLCFEVLLAGSFRLNVYEGGTAASPEGAPIATRDVKVSGLGAQWVHVDLDLDATTAGIPYVLETKGLSVTARWRASCSGGLLGGSCDPNQPDRYPDGNTNSSLGPNADFGFRSHPLHDADLVGSVDAPGVVCPGLDVTGSLTGSITNESQTSVGPFAVDHYLSSDTALDGTDTLLPDSRVSVPGLAPGETVAASPTTAIPSDAASGRAYVLQVVDADDEVVEASDGEGAANVFGGPTAVTGCGSADIPDLALSADAGEVPAGMRSLAADQVPPEALPDTTAVNFGAVNFGGLDYGAVNFGAVNFGAVNFGAVNFGAVNFGPVNFGAVNFGAVNFGGIGQHDLSTLLDQVPEDVLDASLLIDVPGPDWAELFPDVPIQDLTLLDVLDADLPLTVGDVDLSQVIDLTWFGLAWSTTPLQDLGIDCAFLGDHGFGCAEFDLDPATATPLTIDALGFPMEAVLELDTTLADVLVPATAPLAATSLVGEGRYLLEASAFGALLLAEDLRDAGAVVDCSEGALCDTGTLAEAVEVGAVRDVTMATLLAELTPSAAGGIPVDDAVDGLRPFNDWPWLPVVTHLDFPTLGTCPTQVVRYHLTGTSTGGADLVDPVFTATHPSMFDYVPGSGELTASGATVAVEPTIELDDQERQTLRFASSAVVTGEFDLSWLACGGLALGPWASDAAVEGEDTTGFWAFAVDDQAPVTVTQRGEPDDPDTPSSMAPDELWVGHLDGEGDVDHYSIPVPDRPGVVTRFILQPPPQVDYDATAYGPAIDPLDTAAVNFGAVNFGAVNFGGDPIVPVADGDTPQGADRGTEHTDTLQDAAVNFGPTDSSGIEGISHLRGSAVEVIELTSEEGEEGVYTFSVHAFSGTSPLPYVAAIQQFDPGATVDLPACEPAPQHHTGVRGTAPDPSQVGAGPDVLFLVNRMALGEQFGPAAAADAITALQGLATETDPDLDVTGIVLEVDSDDGVFAADRAWRTGDDWCSVVAANEVATEVADVVAEYRQAYPSIRDVVVAGADTAIPGLRVSDDVTLASQQAYLLDALKATQGNNPLVATVAADTYVVDAALGGEAAIPWKNTGLVLPGDVSVSRVVETPEDIIAAVGQYVAADGLIDPTTAFASAYDFMLDGAEAAAQAMTDDGVDVTTLFSETWTAAEQASNLDDGHPLVRPDGHSDHFRQLSAHGSANEDPSDIITSSALGDLPLGGLVLTLGCNFGINVPDVLTDGGDPDQVERRRDWMQEIAGRQAVAFANTGFGYGDDEAIALDERILLDLTGRLFTTENVGRALTEAKYEYVATMGAYGTFDKKAVESMSNFGLGIYRIAGAEPQADPAPAPVGTGTGPASATISGSYALVEAGTCTTGPCLVRQTADDGSVHYAVEGEDSVPLAVSGQFLVPQSNRSLNVDGFRPGGVWPTQRTTHLRVVDDPTVASKVVSRSGHEPPPDVADRAFPVTPGRANDSIRGLQEAAVPLAFVRSNGRDATATDQATIVLTTDYEALVYQVADGDEYRKPEIGRLRVVDTGSGLGITLRARDADSPIVRCAVWVVDAAGASHHVELTPDSFARDVTCSGFLAGMDDALLAQALALDQAGNVGTGGLKGLDPHEVPLVEDGVTFTLPAPDGDNGWYRTDPVLVGVSGPAGVPLTIMLNGSELMDFDGASVEIAGTRIHDLVATGEGVFGRATILIDTRPPACSDLPSGTVSSGSTTVLDWTCSDVGSGVADESATLDGDAVSRGDEVALEVGTHEFVVTVRDHAGHTGTFTSTIEATADFVFEGFFDPVDNDTLNPINAGETVPFKFRVIDRTDGTEVRTTEVVRDATWTPVDCGTGGLLGQPITARSKPSFRYADGHFIFNAVTERKWRTGSCFRFTVTLVDGLSLSADVIVS